MARSRSLNHIPNLTDCLCSKCGQEAHTLKDSSHRKCGGGRYALDPKERGIWTDKAELLQEEEDAEAGEES
jgi:hypothetical protein